MTDLIRQYVDKGRFTDLFVEELGWDRPRRSRDLTVSTDDNEVTLSEVATFKGVTVWACPSLPDGRAQRSVDREVKKESNERLLIFHDGDRQEWRWPQTKNAQGAGSTRLVLHDHVVGRDNPALAQRLAQIEIGLDEDGVSVVEVTRRLKKAFDADKVTKKFYKRFKNQHDDLCDAIVGIATTADEDSATSKVRWYGSLLMNRIMFIYFMQKKGFLDSDRDYLRNRLDRIRQTERTDAPGTFYDFYKHFLLPLFHQGLGHPDTAGAIDDPVIADLVGDIPYVNGGIFSVHPIEAANDIAIDDHVFEALFDFLDDWQWHLDDRPTGDPNEINPDVLGYIFEQFINNKQQGAYYTKEDVTGYMTDNTLIPVFLDRLATTTGINPWQHLTKQPDRYIWNSVAHGCDTDLPADIVAAHDQWPRPAWDETEPGSDLALPGESWWEVVQRREYAADLRSQLRAGDIKSADAAITANIDLETLAVDTIDAIDSPADVVATWNVLTALKVIDPTCGSGAFLFAALTVLHTLYSAVLDAAHVHVKTSTDGMLAEIVAEADKHSSADYYLLKHGALNNIYGVDLMPEAVEVARLRLFLKVIAQVKQRSEIEPLPDLEFNIRPGNILVGAVDEDSIRDLADLTTMTVVDDIVDLAAEAAGAYRAFSDAQASGDTAAATTQRARLRDVTSAATDTLDDWWFGRDRSQAGIDDIDRYLDVHRPFHWPIEFPEVFASGGFDVVIGNPPYVNKRKIDYHYAGFVTDDAPDIYAPCIERASQICRDGGRLAMIVMHSLQFSGRFDSLRRVLRSRFQTIHASTFSRRPSTLFTGAGVRSTIVMGGPGNDAIYTTDTRRWLPQYRPHLMPSLQYTDASDLIPESTSEWPRTGDEDVRNLLVALDATPSSLAEAVQRNGQHTLGYKKTALYYLSVYADPPPAYDADLNPIEQPQEGELSFGTEEDLFAALALLGGLVAMTWWASVGDDFHVTAGVLTSFPVALPRLDDAVRHDLEQAGRDIQKAAPSAPLYTLYAKKWLGNYDYKRLRYVTDPADEIVLRALGLEDHLPTIHRVDARLDKSSGDAGNSIRTWPPPA